MQHLRSVAVLLFVAILAACAKSQQTAAQPTPPPTATIAAASASPSPSPVESTSPLETPSPTPTIPTPPPGLPAGWSNQTERTVNGREAELLVRTGSIDNLGFGWPPHFTPFSGKSTPSHQWVCTSRPGAAPGTDRSELGSGVPVNANGTAKNPLEGYAGCSKRPDNVPQAIPLEMGALPAKIRGVFLQVFVDDFQPVPFHSHFQVTLNGTRVPTFEDAVNQLDQTGPIGKLLTLQLLPEYWPILKSGTVNLLFDDPTTGKADGYAIDFARILVNPKPWRYSVTISCSVVDAGDQKPIARADAAAAGARARTDSTGHCALRNVPAGLVSVSASAVGYDSATQLLDLPAGQVGTANFQLKRHKETVADLKRQIQENGTVAIYGIHFDTASAKIRPDSLTALDQILELVKSSPANWVIAGHTDNQGGAAYNMDLSLARANSVVAWLVKKGVSSNSLTAKGYGFTRPVADNATDAGRALNRRVEVSVQK
ncbi:MAG TPA: OmpA family protein [Candidatus Baltobacteraceae bacterium]|jgi:outer membrane protein OmpA-like peptidoglycan-associated protein|nr:OmpA family protein [Candidatus Baltobacteraceae bacterium]